MEQASPVVSTPTSGEGERGAPASDRLEAAETRGEEPRWLSEIRTQIADRLRPFTTTAREFVFHPARFAKRWAAGERFAMNPMWFAVSAVAVMTTLQSALEELLGVHGHRGVLENGVRTLAPYAYYIEIGLVAHLVLWVLGSKRRLTSSVAMSLYAGGTIATLGQLLVMGALATFTLAKGPAWVGLADPGAAFGVTMMVLLTLSFGAFYTVFATSMGALHDVGAGRMFLANAFAMVASSAICEVLPLPTMHVALRIWHDGRFIAPVFHVRPGF